jgi:hypothetical protein
MKWFAFWFLLLSRWSLAWGLDCTWVGCIERMRILNVENVPAYIQDTTERYITNSSGVNDIRALVAFSSGLGRLTPIMEPYRIVSVPGQGE